MMQSVKSETVKEAPEKLMIQLVQCVQWHIVTLADKYDENTYFKFAKLDLKDGFWRLVVSGIYSQNFCYVIPQDKKVKNIEDIKVVVPNYLQI